MNLEISVETQYAPDGTILQELSNRGIDGMREVFSRQVVYTQDAQTRQALIALGWTPPGKAEGWKLVPVEPTDEMAAAAVKAALKYPPHQRPLNGTEVWPAMLAAVPATPQVPERPASLEGWTEVNLPFGPVCDNEFNPMDSFEERGLNKPGTLIRTERGEEFLIGDINPMRGVCDDCTEFSSETVIVAYRVVWNGGQPR